MAINEERLPDPVNAPAESEQSKKEGEEKGRKLFFSHRKEDCPLVQRDEKRA